MKARFSLDPLLRVRQIREEQQRSTLLIAHAAVERIRRQLATLDEALTARERQRRQTLTAGVAAAELQIDAGWREQALAAREHMVHELQQACSQLEQERERYFARRRDRRLVESLRERLQQELKRKQEKKQQAELDESFLLRRKTESKSS
jgi:flagellar export protein FliJ